MEGLDLGINESGLQGYSTPDKIIAVAELERGRHQGGVWMCIFTGKYFISFLELPQQIAATMGV